MITFQYIPYTEHSKFEGDKKINYLLRIVKENKIVIMEGRLKAEEEAKLIEETMEQITKTFKGVSFCTIYQNKQDAFGDKIKSTISKAILGRREGTTIIGPASIIKEIRRNPNKIELITRTTKNNNFKKK